MRLYSLLTKSDTQPCEVIMVGGLHFVFRIYIKDARHRLTHPNR
jgi:hypothetical protein